MYFHLHRNSKKWTFHSVKKIKCESFSIALRRNSEKLTLLLSKIFKNMPFFIAKRRNSKKLYFYRVRIKKILQILASPLQSLPPKCLARV